MTDSTETDIAREIVTDWLGMFDPPPQIDFQQSEFLQQAIVFYLNKLRAERDAAARVMQERCADVADEYYGKDCEEITARIRALPLAVVATEGKTS